MAERFGIIHERFVALSSDGNRLDGEDVFLAGHRHDSGDAEDQFACGSIFIPETRASRLTNGHGAVLLLRTGKLETRRSRPRRNG